MSGLLPPQAASGERGFFANRGRVPHVSPNLSTLGKYVLEGKPARKWCALFFVIWEHNPPKVPNGRAPFTGKMGGSAERRREALATFTPGEPRMKSDIVRPEGFRPFRCGEVVEITWIPPRICPRSTTESGPPKGERDPFPTKVSSPSWLRAPPYSCPCSAALGAIGWAPPPQHLRVSVRAPGARASPCRRAHHLPPGPFLFPCEGPHGPGLALPHSTPRLSLYATWPGGEPLHPINTHWGISTCLALGPPRPTPSPNQPYPSYPYSTPTRRSTQVCRFSPSPRE
ncbi:hypothetical protein GWK47_003440 [Chionoecetes opilio]|uniref:Uncharacterized protein n=1 Tax=Chionoecetes opilio TaxID=41210 RepID=A0A8J4YMI5_CHIOP|nr:hypothetical protein GWK47_003440 [Chionoecetes opilio]